MTALSKIQNSGFEVSLHGLNSIAIVPASKLTQLQRNYIRTYKPEITKHLRAANDEVLKRYVYSYAFTNSDGRRIWITDDKLEQPKATLQARFPSREIERLIRNLYILSVLSICYIIYLVLSIGSIVAGDPGDIRKWCELKNAPKI